MESPDPETPQVPDRDPGERTTAERLDESFATLVEAFRAAARRVRAGSDAEAIHDLRVATRRLAAALRVWGSLIPREARREALKCMRRLRRRIGR
ncbi:MAG TPA: CHAD domain-containing protein, partial [Candidatus Eisenbacteria bacterium]|nr:CHAD domain-containing protein [Candidatus Eisenbacteria bacterium]